MKYNVLILNSCKKDIKLATKQGRNVDLLFQVVDELSDGKTLDPKYKDHKLVGKFDGMRECHIEPDFLLIYKIDGENLILFLVRVGTHSELFK